jgi:hypothetical protein
VAYDVAENPSPVLDVASKQDPVRQHLIKVQTELRFMDYVIDSAAIIDVKTYFRKL